MLESGEGAGQDLAGAVNWYRKAMENGVMEARMNLARGLLSSERTAGNLLEAVKLLRPFAEEGDVELQMTLGQLYRDEAEPVRDDIQSIKFLKLAAEQGHAGAQLLLADMYQTGRGTDSSLPKAYWWYQLVSLRGVELARHNSAVILRMMSKEEMVEAQALLLQSTGLTPA